MGSRMRFHAKGAWPVRPIYIKTISISQIQVVIFFENLSSKKLVDFILKRWTEINTLKNKENTGLNYFYNNIEISRKTIFPKLSTFDLYYEYIKTEEDYFNIENESKNIKKQVKIDENSETEIKIKKYEKSFKGIKQRSLPVEERKKYLINPENIINELDQRTTIMIKNIPKKISQKFLINLFNRDFENDFNFFYLPIDFSKNVNVGYAFMNFKNCRKIVKFFLEFNQKPWPFNKNMICYISYARIQGFKAITQHFEKSSIMNQSQDELKPFIDDI